MDSRGAPPQADEPSLESFVRAARRRAAAASSARSLAVAALAACVSAAAIELDGGDSSARAACGVAGLAGLFAGATWWRGERVEAREFVRTVDARLSLEGALATAQEARTSDRASLATLLARRTAARLGARDLLRAAPWPAIGWLAAPLFGWALWLAAERARPTAAPHIAELAATVGATLSAAPMLERAQSDAARELAARVAAAAADARTDPAALAAEVRKLGQQLLELAQAESAAPPLALELAAAGQRLEAAARALASHGPRGGAGAGGAEHAPLASGPDQSTMKGSAAPRPGLPTPADERDTTRTPRTSLQGSAAPTDSTWNGRGEPPVLSGRWWAAEHDAVVAAWREGAERPR